MTSESPSFVYDEAAFENLCSQLVEAGFSPEVGSSQRSWVGPIRGTLSTLTDAEVMRLVVPEGWPAKALKVFVPGLVADHVLTPSGYICLWADDDPAQVQAQEWADIETRLDSWVESALQGFRPEDRALDAWAVFDEGAASRAELDVPDLLGEQPTDGEIRSAHARHRQILELSRRAKEEYPLEGVIYFRQKLGNPPRTLSDFRGSLTRRQKANLDHGLQRRAKIDHLEPSGGYDFAVLVWPQYDQYNVLMLTFEGAGKEISARSVLASPGDVESRLRRAGPDAPALREKKVLIAGVGALGGQVAVSLACSGVGEIQLHDNDDLRSVNLVRHVAPDYLVGFRKTTGVRVLVEGSAPWCQVTEKSALPLGPESVRDIVKGFDLVVDCTGTFAASLAVGVACQLEGVPLLAAALYRSGNVFRIRRQAEGDLPLAMRGEPEFPSIPAGDDAGFSGFLELGCTAPIHNAPPAHVTRAAADTSLAALDLLTGRLILPEETVTVLTPLDVPPFDKLGTLAFPAPASEGERSHD